jgi:acyl-CoA synthetase (AMP-forming)/AMP-acid ligase II
VSGANQQEIHTIPAFIGSLVQRFGDREAIVGGNHRLSYREVDEQSRLLARGLLARGMAKGAHVGIWMGNGPDWLVSWLAVTRAGGVCVALSTFSQGRELAKVVRHSDLQGILMRGCFAGHDMKARLVGALPELGDAAPGAVLRTAPWLRFVVLIDDEEAPWARPRSWLMPPEIDPAFDDGLLEEIESSIAPGDLAMMIYTSGSTSDPKGVMHTHDSVVTKARYLHGQFDFPSDERSLTVLPFFWVGGLAMSLLPVLDAGGTQICVERFDTANVLEVIEAERVTRAGFYEDRVQQLVDHPDFATRDRSTLRVSNPELLVTDGYGYGHTYNGLEMGLGMSETFGPYWWGRFDEFKDDVALGPGGRFTPPLEELQPDVDFRVVDSAGNPVADGERGEIQVRGSCITVGHYKVPSAATFTDDGFLRTGDTGQVVGPKVYFRGRLNDMIKTAGANVAPAEVSAALMELEGVAAAHVVGVPDAARGSSVAAAVVAAPGVTLDPEALRAALRKELSGFKVPSHIVVMDASEIPWNEGSNKLRAKDLKELLVQRISASGVDR